MAEFALDIVEKLIKPVGSVGVSFKEGQTAIGNAVVQALKNHFAQLAGQRHRGYTSRNFYAQAQKTITQEFGTSPNTPSGRDILIRVNHPGLALRYFGGIVKAGAGTSCTTGKPTKYLTIPAIPEAHGKENACHFGNLKFVRFGKSEDAPAALVEVEKGAATHAETGKKVYGKKGKTKDRANMSGRRIFFWLVKSTTHKPDPSVLPTIEELEKAAADAGIAWLASVGGKTFDTPKIGDYS